MNKHFLHTAKCSYLSDSSQDCFCQGRNIRSKILVYLDSFARFEVTPIFFLIPWNLMCRACHANVPTIHNCDWSKPMVSLLAIESCHIMVSVISNKLQKRCTLSADYLFRHIMFHNILFLINDLVKMSLIIKLPYTIQALKEWDALLNVLIAEMIKWNFISEKLMLLNNW